MEVEREDGERKEEIGLRRREKERENDMRNEEEREVQREGDEG
jgi:hypothetical protein